MGVLSLFFFKFLIQIIIKSSWVLQKQNGGFIIFIFYIKIYFRLYTIAIIDIFKVYTFARTYNHTQTHINTTNHKILNTKVKFFGPLL